MTSAPQAKPGTPTTAQPPVAPRRDHQWERPTGPVDDPYAWMRDVTDRELLDHLRAENEYADAWFEPHAHGVEELFDEIRSRVQETDLSAPIFNGGWWYAAATQEGRSYPSHHRGRTRDTATDQLLLDENVEAELAGSDDGGYFDLGAFDASHDHRLFA